jgi:hypothetical protein
MYAALWRILPGPIWVRILIVVVLLAAVLFALSTWVFPWIDDLTTPAQDVTVEQ